MSCEEDLMRQVEDLKRRLREVEEEKEEMRRGREEARGGKMYNEGIGCWRVSEQGIGLCSVCGATRYGKQ